MDRVFVLAGNKNDGNFQIRNKPDKSDGFYLQSSVKLYVYYPPLGPIRCRLFAEVFRNDMTEASRQDLNSRGKYVSTSLRKN